MRRSQRYADEGPISAPDGPLLARPKLRSWTRIRCEAVRRSGEGLHDGTCGMDAAVGQREACCGLAGPGKEGGREGDPLLNFRDAARGRRKQGGTFAAAKKGCWRLVVVIPVPVSERAVACVAVK